MDARGKVAYDLRERGYLLGSLNLYASVRAAAIFNQ